MQKTTTTTVESKGPVKPELLPADLGGGHIQFIKRNDYAKRTADTLALKWKAEINRTHIISMLEALDAGKRDMPEDTPKELAAAFDIVTEDYDAAVAEVKRLAEEKEELERKAEEEKKEKAEKEERLVLSVRDKAFDLASLSAKFETGDMDRFIPKGKVSDEDMLAAFNSSMRMSEFTNWMQGDLVAELEKRGLENVVSRLAEAAGKHYTDVYNNAKTAKAFPPDTRQKGISFTIYREMGSAKYTDEQKKQLPALVKEVAEGKHTVQSVRKAVQAIKGKVDGPTVAPEDSEKATFYVIDPGLADNPQQFITVATGFPKELTGGDVTIIDIKTGLRFTSMNKKPENRWEELPEYYKPEPAPEPPANLKKGAGNAKKKK